MMMFRRALPLLPLAIAAPPALAETGVALDPLGVICNPDDSGCGGNAIPPPEVGRLGWACAAPSAANPKIECKDATGEIVRPQQQHMHVVRIQIGLSRLGCPVEVLDGNFEADSAALQCAEQMFSRQSEPFSPEELDGIARIGVHADAAAIADEIAYFTLEQASRFRGPQNPTAHMIHPEAEKFIHPQSQPYLAGADSNFLAWVSGDKYGSWTEARWADPAAFSGRRFYIVEDGMPLFQVEFGPSSGKITDPDGNMTETPYQTQGGFTCIPDPAGYDGECLGIGAHNIAGPGEPWITRAALFSAGAQGITQPVLFGDISEDSAAWDAAIAARETRNAEWRAALADGSEAHSLPLDGISPAAAYVLGSSYDGGFIPDSPFESGKMIPFLAYHFAYAETCADQFDGPARIWENTQTRLIEQSHVPGDQYQIYEIYVADRVPIQAEYYADFAAGIVKLDAMLLADGPRARQEGYDLAVDFLKVIDRNFMSMTRAHIQLLDRIGCSGATTDRLERNLASSFASLNMP